ncbi:hypothetical protein [Rhodoferax ferrireducens]|uniref:hypothetical protein n=1 Tax=Rhodoferax ferrireducens TaxID=192843 RepID=UPI000E0D4814|nr:hypothetical protein [Rhodoferax ferrireducens]
MLHTQLSRTEQIVQRLSSAWHGSPPVTVVRATIDLPIPAPEDVRGMWFRGGAWIVVNTQPLSAVGGTLAHEAIGHGAMRETLGQHWRGFMHNIQSGLRGGDHRLHYFREHVRSVYVDDSGVCNLSPVSESDEITAALVEHRFDGESGRLSISSPLRKFLRAASGHFYREALYLDRPVDFEQLEGTILAAEHRLRHGGSFFGIGFRLRRWYASGMSKPWNPNAPPMSLAESERLLKAESDRLRRQRDSKFGFDGLVLIAGLILLPLCALLVIYGFLSPFFR